MKVHTVNAHGLDSPGTRSDHPRFCWASRVRGYEPVKESIRGHSGEQRKPELTPKSDCDSFADTLVGVRVSEWPQRQERTGRAVYRCIGRIDSIRGARPLFKASRPFHLTSTRGSRAWRCRSGRPTSVRFPPSPCRADSEGISSSRQVEHLIDPLDLRSPLGLPPLRLPRRARPLPARFQFDQYGLFFHI